MKNIETTEQHYNELVGKKAKAEAQLDLLRDKIANAYEELEKDYGVTDLEGLDSKISEMEKEYLARKTKAIKEQEQLVRELNDVINAVKV